MMILQEKREQDSMEMRAAYCQALIDEAAVNERIVAVNCDLRSSMGLKPFAAAYPERELNVGIQEANGCSMAAGMSAAGLIPFFNTFSVFASRRVYDQIFQSCAYAGLNVKIIGGDAGVSAALNGGTHMPFEDLGIMRLIPGVKVMEASDAVMLRALIHQIAGEYGVHYLRFCRKALPKIYKEGTDFVIGKAMTVRDGSDVTVITYGMLVNEALKAAEELAAEGISVRVLDMFTIKPIDREAVLRAAAETGAIVTAENHHVMGGLNAAVAEVLVSADPVPVESVGVGDEFGEVGNLAYLMERFALTAPHISSAVRRALQRKG